MLSIRVIAPEDLEPMMFVVEHERLVVIGTSCDVPGRPPEIRRVWMPAHDSTPLKVIDICMPFVLAREPGGTHRVVDLRHVRLARLPEVFARPAMERLKDQKSFRLMC